MLFGEVWSREDKLPLRDRSLITVVALMSQGLTGTSFVHHLEMAKANGITKSEIAEIITHAALQVSNTGTAQQQTAGSPTWQSAFREKILIRNGVKRWMMKRMAKQ